MKNDKLCIICGKEKAEFSENFGYLPCKSCQEEARKIPKPKRQVEFTSEQIKEARKVYKKDIIQPYRDGVLSKEYLEQYGTKGIKPSEEDIKNAKYVWNDGEYYKS
jgi:hypothetical protein